MQFSKEVLSGSQFSDLELFRMFNIDIGAGLVDCVRRERVNNREFAKKLAVVAREAKGKMLWHETPRQKSGIVENFDTTKSINEVNQRKIEIERLRKFYAKMSATELLSHDEHESPILW